MKASVGAVFLGGFVVGIGCTVTGTPSPLVVPPGVDVPTGPLPRSVVPRHYSLDLNVDPDAPRFAGTVRIAVTVQETLSQVWLHGRDLQVRDVWLELAGGERVAAEYAQATRSGVAWLQLSRAVAPQDATLVFDYEAPFPERDLEGLYRVREGDAWYVFTQFEPTAARRCFPGFDEPAFKVPFDVSLTVPNDHVAAGNAPAVDVRPVGAQRRRVQFARTPPLPTYLIALAVGPFDVVEGGMVPPNRVRSRPVPLRGLAVSGKGERLRYALENTAGILDALETYTGTPYPYAKLDVVAVPDFSFGAMENPGLITYREWLLLLDPARASMGQRYAYASVHAHELAHQWFGNLVTMPWWDDIWLNEAFASWFGDRAVHAWRPEYGFDLKLIQGARRAAAADTLRSARQIRQPIQNDDDILNAFDSITYRKGGAVLAMFETYLGPDLFQQGVRAYLEKHALSTATADQFIDAMEEATGQPLRAAFESFLLQPGVPTVDTQLTCAQGTATLTATQRRYAPVGVEAPAQTWTLPFCYRYGSAQGPVQNCRLLRQPQETWTVPSCPRWFMPNAGGNGYYRWSVADTAWSQLFRRWSSLSTGEQLSVAENLDAGFRAGTVELSTLLQGAAVMARSESRQVVAAPLSVLRFVHDHVVSPAQQRLLRARLGAMYQPVAQRLGVVRRDGEGADDALLRPEVLAFVAMVVQDPSVRGALRDQGLNTLGLPAPGAPAAPELRSLAVGLAAQLGPDAAVPKALEVLGTATDPTLRRAVVRGLGRVTQPDRAAVVRDTVLGDRLRRNERLGLVEAQVSETENVASTWIWLQKNFDALVATLPEVQAGRLPQLFSNFCTAAEASAVETFFRSRVNTLRGGPRTLRLAVEKANDCAAVVAHHRPRAASQLAPKPSVSWMLPEHRLRP